MRRSSRYAIWIRIRSFLTSTGPVAIVDLPLVPVFLVMCALVHYQLGIVASIGAIALTAVTFLTERASRVHSRELTAETGIRSAMLEGNRQNNEFGSRNGYGGCISQGGGPPSMIAMRQRCVSLAM